MCIYIIINNIYIFNAANLMQTKTVCIKYLFCTHKMKTFVLTINESALCHLKDKHAN